MPHLQNSPSNIRVSTEESAEKDDKVIPKFKVLNRKSSVKNQRKLSNILNLTTEKTDKKRKTMTKMPSLQKVSVLHTRQPSLNNSFSMTMMMPFNPKLKLKKKKIKQTPKATKMPKLTLNRETLHQLIPDAVPAELAMLSKD